MNDKSTAENNNTPVKTKMKYLFQSKSLSRTIIGWFLLLSVLPMTLVAWVSYHQANISLTKNAKDKLETAAKSQITFLNLRFPVVLPRGGL